jgi:SPP1 gp7 family putative phage head morphogenesis protein
MIARTEVIGANNEGALHRYELSQIDTAEFMAAPDACEECIPLDGQEYKVVDAHGVIPVHPNCRCTWLAVLK